MSGPGLGKSQSLRSAGIVNLAALELFVQTSSLFQGFHKNDPGAPTISPTGQMLNNAQAMQKTSPKL